MFYNCIYGKDIMTISSRLPLEQRIHGCWLGKSIGGTLGLPVEGRTERMALTYYDPVPELAPPTTTSSCSWSGFACWRKVPGGSPGGTLRAAGWTTFTTCGTSTAAADGIFAAASRPRPRAFSKTGSTRAWDRPSGRKSGRAFSREMRRARPTTAPWMLRWTTGSRAFTARRSVPPSRRWFAADVPVAEAIATASHYLPAGTETARAIALVGEHYAVGLSPWESRDLLLAGMTTRTSRTRR